MLDSFFYTLTASRYAVPISALADRARAAEVIDAIIFHHNVIVAQLFGTHSRIKADQPDPKYGSKDLGVFERTGQGSLNDTYSATIIGNPNNLPARVRRSGTATRVIQALLGTTLVLSIVGWYFGPRQGILPRSPTSIASVLAMLVDGNIFSLCEEQSGEGSIMSFSEMADAVGDMHLFAWASALGATTSAVLAYSQ
ncbi:hypothetical protein RRF57_005819 [Xylaria bambusicola]|uniref:Uncharacterized protein n=1 Tax=Xylaria bambusicola TaxID=326684 RepID=A0AAN7UQX9_9PEZI